MTVRRKRPLEERIIQNIMVARSLRELARLSNSSLSTVQYILRKLMKRGEIKWVPRYTFFGLIKVGIIFSLEDRDFPPIREEALPNGVEAVYELLGLGERYIYVSGVFPRILLSKAIEIIEENLQLRHSEKVSAKEYITWHPRIQVLEEDVDDQQLISLLEKLRVPLKEFESPRNPDKIDLMLLAGKEAFGPFTQLNKIYRKLGGLAGVVDVSRQVLSYHYNHHVLPGWQYNTFIEQLPADEIPLRLILLKGKEAAALARALMHVKHSMIAYVDQNSALVMAQYPCKLLKLVYRLISCTSISRVNMTIMKPIIHRKIPRYWKFISSEGEWTLG